MNQTLLRRIAAMAAVLATALALAACSSDNDNGPSDAQIQDAATTTTAPATTTATTETEEKTETEETTQEASADGKAVFTENCAGCHTLADADASGSVGPNLDDAKPSKDTVATTVKGGKGAMPAFEGQLSEDEIEAVAEYVSSSAG